MITKESLPSPVSDEEITRLVFDGVEDDGQNGDFIVVLGFRDVIEDRVPKAVELYKSGRAPKIVFSGAPVVESKYGPLSEGALMARCAMESGVPASDIIIDDLARTTEENMICSMLFMQRHMKFQRIKRVLIVSSPQHLKRAHYLARQFWPDHIAISLCPADKLINSSTWNCANEGLWRKYVIREAQFLSEIAGAGFIE